jgi:two-component system LytT family sensor kinase
MMADRRLKAEEEDDFDDESDADPFYPADFSTNAAGASANDTFRKRFFLNHALTDRMEMPAGNLITRRLPDAEIALKSILGFWLLYIALNSVRSLILRYPEFWDSMWRRGAAATMGVAITFLVYLAMRRLGTASLARKATVAGLLCLPASFAYASFNYYLFYILKPWPEEKLDKMWQGMSPLEMAVRSISEGALSWYFLFAAWAALYVAMSYAKQLRAADNRAAAFAREAQEAQLRALRYQINPHFLFNTLNSLSSLILSQRTNVAERMIMNLSTFFRTTLSADPTADISLEEELKLQRLYLDIEQIRFPERLKVDIDVPPHLLTVRVPVLILQPIVENAIKYGVARSRGEVTVRISAFEEAGRLHLKVKDNGEIPVLADWSHSGSTGVGLKNVCERLIARYGTQAGCFHGPDPEGGFSVHVIMPIIRNN